MKDFKFTSLQKKFLKWIFIFVFVFISSIKSDSVYSQDINTMLDSYNVSWNTPGPSSAESMPIGNGDIGLNVWVENNGDINFYIGKTDAWGEDNYSEYGLLKLGQVKISLNPRPAVSPFVQVLKLRTGEIQVTENNTTYKIWVDANNPVIRVEANSTAAAQMTVSLIDWRTTTQNGVSADVILNQTDKIAWYHRNSATADSHVANRTFGAIIKGTGFVTTNSTTLTESGTPTSHVVSIYPLTTTTGTATDWLTQVNQKVSDIDALNLETTRTAHQAWWNNFWHRSWVFVTGDATATTTTQGYILQRFKTACAGRGAYPIKFNGSIFTVDNPSYNTGSNTIAVNADYRTWGGQYWFQNTRAMYWPRLAAGDFDMMLPLFNMYKNMLAANTAQVNSYYSHAGAYFAETAPFWGGLPYAGPEVTENWTLHYFTPILELSMMMLDYYEFTGDETFATNTMLPIAKAGITFFDKHFTRDGNGKLLLNPDNAIEMFWKVNNPAPDIAGLKAILTRLIALPSNLADAPTKAAWTTLLNQIPDLPTGTVNSKNVLLPYTGPQTAIGKNSENPELYSVYPFRLYGPTKPDLELAQNTFDLRAQTFKGCWSQDPIQAAMLGMANVAKSYVSFNLARKDARLKFPAFWEKANDYSPDEDNGGNGENGLQQMIMYTDGTDIILNAAWPVGWNCDFKLNAPLQTTVQGSIINGSITNLVITPASRLSDVTIVQPSSYPVTAYQNCNYAGWAVGLQEGSYTLSQLASFGVTNDDLSSLKIQSGYKVTLYGDDNFSANSVALTADANCLTANTFDNVTSSLKIEKVYPVTAFGDCAYAGFTVGLNIGTYTLNQLAALGVTNDALSSIKVQSGYKVTLYGDDNFSASSVVLTTDVNCLTANGFDNVTSSLKIEKISEAPFGQSIWLQNSGYYVSSENGAQAMTCSNTSTGTWEMFQVVDAGNGLVALRGSNGLYVTSTSPMQCIGTTINSSTQFVWEKLSETSCALKSTSNNYVCSESGATPMNCNRTAVGAWETFTWGTNLITITPDLKENNDILITPNPASDFISIQTKEVAYAVSIYSLEGKLLLKQENLTNTSTINISKLKKGLYIVKISTSYGDVNKQIVIAD